jgi:RNA recognition motif-containing protein
MGEYPSRTLFVRNINIHTSDEELLQLFQQHGEIRTMYTACKHRGFVMITYYDIRAATRAKQMLQVWATL